MNQEVALLGLAEALSSRALLTVVIGALCLAMAIPLVVVALNSFRDSMVPGGPRETRSRGHRMMRLLRCYLLVLVSGFLLVIGTLRLADADTWAALLDPAGAAILVMQRELVL